MNSKFHDNSQLGPGGVQFGAPATIVQRQSSVLIMTVDSGFLFLFFVEESIHDFELTIFSSD